ncbi:hypothetical protein [Hymenobacter ruricola]|uniref:Uncharacterized protein n=1 Tax=Hymenobacter ruricola TaxID=2791023 RepID=A0ABS0I7L9_9BACT|nr:hypothetical protein [Hymenobacter ruricola]MBF9222971.1 hypothetical protein [Hymenobacter ruricola]
MRHFTRFFSPLVLLLTGLLPNASVQAQEPGDGLPGPHYTNCYPTLPPAGSMLTGAPAGGGTRTSQVSAIPPGGTPAKSSTYGGALTPRGVLKVLVIFAGFDNDVNIQSPDYYDLNGSNPWPQEDGIHPPGLSFPKNVNTDFYSNAASFQPGALDHTLSNFYYQMSLPSGNPLKMQAVFFPKRINVHATNFYNTDPTYGGMVEVV